LSLLGYSSAFTTTPWGFPKQQLKQSHTVAHLADKKKASSVEIVYDTNFEGIDLAQVYGRDRIKRKLRRMEIRQVSFSDLNSNKSKETLKLIIAGAPASGKGTQCEIIKKKYGVVHLSTGDMLRAAVAAQTEVGKAAKEYMDSGKLVPDSVIIGVVRK